MYVVRGEYLWTTYILYYQIDNLSDSLAERKYLKAIILNLITVIFYRRSLSVNVTYRKELLKSRYERSTHVMCSFLIMI